MSQGAIRVREHHNLSRDAIEILADCEVDGVPYYYQTYLPSHADAKEKAFAIEEAKYHLIATVKQMKLTRHQATIQSLRNCGYHHEADALEREQQVKGNQLLSTKWIAQEAMNAIQNSIQKQYKIHRNYRDDLLDAMSYGVSYSRLDDPKSWK